MRRSLYFNHKIQISFENILHYKSQNALNTRILNTYSKYVCQLLILLVFELFSNINVRTADMTCSLAILGACRIVLNIRCT